MRTKEAPTQGKDIRYTNKLIRRFSEEEMAVPDEH
jgi:hypothetical protein